MMYVWWDWKVIVDSELLSISQTINSVLYCKQLERLRQAIERILLKKHHEVFRLTNIFDVKTSLAWLLNEKCPQKPL